LGQHHIKSHLARSPQVRQAEKEIVDPQELLPADRASLRIIFEEEMSRSLGTKKRSLNFENIGIDRPDVINNYPPGKMAGSRNFNLHKTPNQNKTNKKK